MVSNMDTALKYTESIIVTNYLKTKHLHLRRQSKGEIVGQR